MATSQQDRLKLKQYSIDVWTTREHLCLASAVLRSGDQNWVAVSRTIRTLTTETSRPLDWYSNKNCALQYAKLLERIDTPKRKREKGDSTETAGEIITKMLSKQWADELKVLVSEEKADYIKAKKEVQQLEAGLLDHQLDQMWDQIVREQEQEDEDERKHETWLKEREEKLSAVQMALKQQGMRGQMLPYKKIVPANENSTSLENSSSCTSADFDGLFESQNSTDNLVEMEETAVLTENKVTPSSPLLSSLLNKSPMMQAGSGPSQISPRMKSALLSPNVSPALQSLVSSAISGTTLTGKDSISRTLSFSPGAGAPTLSRLLELPPSTPGHPLPKIADFPSLISEQIISQVSELKCDESFLSDEKKIEVGIENIEVKEEKMIIVEEKETLNQEENHRLNDEPQVSFMEKSKVGEKETDSGEGMDEKNMKIIEEKRSMDGKKNKLESKEGKMELTDNKNAEIEQLEGNRPCDGKEKEQTKLTESNKMSTSPSITSESGTPSLGHKRLSLEQKILISSPERIMSPVSSTSYGDDPEAERAYKAWKKSILILWNDISSHKSASLFLKPISEEQVARYHSMVFRPMDLLTIKRNVESGQIRTTAEFHRDVLLTLINAQMYNSSDHVIYTLACQMMKDTKASIEEFVNLHMASNFPDSKILRREVRDSTSKKSEVTPKRKRESLADEKTSKKRRV